MYWKDTYEFLNSNDIEYKWEGKYGAKGEKRQKKKKATPEQTQKTEPVEEEREVWRKTEMEFLRRRSLDNTDFPRGHKDVIAGDKKDND